LEGHASKNATNTRKSPKSSFFRSKNHYFDLILTIRMLSEAFSGLFRPFGESNNLKNARWPPKKSYFWSKFD